MKAVPEALKAARKVVTAMLEAMKALLFLMLVLEAAHRAFWAVLGAVKAVPEALRAVRKVVTAILEVMKALLRPKGPTNQDCQQTRGLSESGRSWLLRTLKVLPKAFESCLSRLDGFNHVLESWL